jgi:uncharacterized RDD family membrane protein YckC
LSGAPPPVRAAQARAAALAKAERSRPGEAAPDQGPAGTVYVGLVTRAIAFSLDAAIVNGVAALVGIAVGLGLSILHLPEQADIAIAAVLAALWIVWSVIYFAFFWSTTGQTPGSRVMRIRVIDGGSNGRIKPLRAAARFGALILAAIPLFAGILMMLWDDRRRCLQDRLVRTLVVEAPAPLVVARFPGEPRRPGT